VSWVERFAAGEIENDQFQLKLELSNTGREMEEREKENTELRKKVVD